MKAAVVAFGGNALIGQDGKGSYEEQMMKTETMCGKLLYLFDRGYRVVITHGNGPQVGNFLIQQEYLANVIPPMPLDVCNAMTQGQMGYMIEQKLRNIFIEKNINKSITAFVTQVVVSKDDPAFKNPSKFIGPFFNKKERDKLQKKESWVMKKDSGRGYRRVVPSPMPIDIVEKVEIVEMIRRGFVVIASGGGGIPVLRDKRGKLKGVTAVIDKDLVAEMLASFIGAEILLLVTPVDHVSIFYGTPKQKNLRRMTLKEARHYLDEGHFPAGSMGPKIEASIRFLNSGGKKTIITSIEKMEAAINGECGTEITRR